MRVLALALALLALVSCSKTQPSDAGAPDAGPPPSVLPHLKAGVPQHSQFKVVNACQYPIWIQQLNMPSDTPGIQPLMPGEAYAYKIPPEGLASTRFWPKTGCDDLGQNCQLGQTMSPCPPGTGCMPPVDSMIEATWGCQFPNPAQCASTPQGNKIDMTTWWNASAVGGYTLPYTITISGGDGRPACAPVDCSGLTAAGCPTDDNLSTGGKFPQYASQNEHVQAPDAGANVWQGCFATCMKLNYPTFGGDNAGAPADPALQMYCCPTPPISAPTCQHGPVPNTKYVKAVHTMCKNTVYGYAYDDTIGLRNCSVDVKITMTFGPNCP